MRKPNNYRSKKKGTKRDYKGKGAKDQLDDFSDSKEMRKKSTNASAWYALNPQLLKDAASYPFSQPLGRRFATNSATVTKYQTVPGVCAIRVAPTFGFGGRINLATQTISADVNNPINVAAAELYTWVRHKNSGAKNYEAADLMIYICSMSQVYSAITWAMRIYGLARMFEQRNRYMPISLIQANGVDAYSVINNLADFRYRLNVVINKVASLKVPADISLFNRQAFLYQNVYSEGLSVKDQLYMYVPAKFLRFGLNAGGQGELATAETIPAPNSASLLTYTQVIDIIDRMFQAIWDEEDFATMSGDIDKAFEGNVLTLNSMNEDYGLIPIYDEIVLTQMKNTKVTGTSYNAALHQVPTTGLTTLLVPLNYMVQSNLGLQYISDTYASMDFLASEHPLTVNAIDPDPSVVIEATRMFAVEEYRDYQTDGSGASKVVSYLACGTEYATTIFYGHFDGGSQAMDWNRCTGVLCNNETTTIPSGFWTNLKATMFKYGLIKAFKYAPEEWHYWAVNVSPGVDYPTLLSSAEIANVAFEVDNYTTVGPEELMKMHESAMLSLLHVGSYSSNATV